MKSNLTLRQGLWMPVCFCISLALHVLPVWYILFGPVYDPAQPMEIDLQALHSYRERIFRELASSAQSQPPPPPIQISVVSPPSSSQHLRLSTDLSEADLQRARVIQTALHNLWTQMYCTESGQAIVRLDVREDGQIRGFAVTSLQGNAEFQSFLATFLNVFQASYDGQAGPGQILNLECEFVVRPTRHFTQRNQ